MRLGTGQIAAWLRQRFELARGGSAENLRWMEGLRGFAVFLVFLVHYVSLISPLLRLDAQVLVPAKALHAMGNTGVDLFFVLSGYLIYRSLISRKQPFLQFMRRRAERIYPAFTAVFALYVALSFVFPAERKIPDSALDAAVYLAQNFLLLPGIFPMEPMITVAWSLSYEMFFYIVLPIFIGLLRFRSVASRVRVILLLGAAMAFAVYTAVAGGPVRLIMFIAGMLLFEVSQSRRAAPPNSLGLTALLVGLFATLLPLRDPGAESIKVSILFVTFFTLCWTCFRHPSGWLARLFGWTWLRWLGNMSYSYYLLHGLALKGGFLLLHAVCTPNSGGSWFFIALLPPMLMLTLVTSASLFLAIERPFSLGRGARSDPRATCEKPATT